MIAVGLTVPQLGDHVTRDAVRRFCEDAEELGFASLWVQEHLYFPMEPSAPYAARPGMTVPEIYRTTLAATELLMAAAAWTDTMTIGTSILVGGYHRPVELAQRLATIDVLSGGRLVAGFSVGWSKDEHDQMDVEFHSRGRRMDELLDALLVCWGPDPVRHAGEFFSIGDAIVRPKPLQRPRPLLLSGMRSPAGLRRTAERFDIWNPASGTVEQIQAAMATMAAMRPAGMAPLRVHQKIFPDPPFVAAGLQTQTIDQMADAVRRAAAAGFEQVVIDLSFDRAVRSPDDWAAAPRRLSPLLEAAR